MTLKQRARNSRAEKRIELLESAGHKAGLYRTAGLFTGNPVFTVRFDSGREEVVRSQAEAHRVFKRVIEGRERDRALREREATKAASVAVGG